MSLNNHLAEEERRFKVGFWIDTLEDQAELVEHIIERGLYDLQTIRKLEGAAVELWFGAYIGTARNQVREWASDEAQQEALQQAEDRMKAAQAAATEAYEVRLEQARLEAELDPAELHRLDEKRRARGERIARITENADTA